MAGAKSRWGRVQVTRQNQRQNHHLRPFDPHHHLLPIPIPIATAHLSPPILFLLAVVVTPTDYLQAGTPLIRGLEGLHRTGVLPRHVPVGILYRYNTGTALHSEYFGVYLRLHEALQAQEQEQIEDKDRVRLILINSVRPKTPSDSPWRTP